MTPARRKRLLRNLLLIFFLLLGLAVASVCMYCIGKGLPLQENVAAILLGRKPGSAKPGTLLVHETPSTNASPFLHAPGHPSAPIKLKFNLLGIWTYTEGKTPIPEKIRALDGKRVEITGFMMPINEPQRLTRFIVVQSLWGCCFGQTPAVNHVIVVTMEPGKVVNFYPDPVRVTGIFSVGETREEGYLVSIYRLVGDKVTVR
jgi:hypothetical protein